MGEYPGEYPAENIVLGQMLPRFSRKPGVDRAESTALRCKPEAMERHHEGGVELGWTHSPVDGVCCKLQWQPSARHRKPPPKECREHGFARERCLFIPSMC